jgi:N-acetylglucosaminyldiphosphoundecaprenol N-acetyl-beta-D-mannosaminyltransferase
MPFKQIRILGTPLAATNYRELIDYCHRIAMQSGVYAIDFTNTHIVTLRRHDLAFHAMTNCFDLFIPDGMPLVWCLNPKGAQLRDRIYGPTFMRQCIADSPAPFTHYFLGGSSECVELLRKKFGAKSGVRIVGSRHGYFTAGQEEEVIAEINHLAPNFVWVGLGTPRQQAWIHRNKRKLTRGILLAVGFAFDVNAGLKRDAPAWMQRCGLTWAFRALSEPRRLVSRYLTYNFLFLFYLIKDRCFSNRSRANGS